MQRKLYREAVSYIYWWTGSNYAARFGAGCLVGLCLRDSSEFLRTVKTDLHAGRLSAVDSVVAPRYRVNEDGKRKKVKHLWP